MEGASNIKPMKTSLLIIIFLLNSFLMNAQKKPVQVTLDCYFNQEVRTNPDGKPERFHYIWEETAMQGFSLFGSMFTQSGAKLSSLEAAPTKKNLKNTDIFIIVDPDNLKDNTTPNRIEKSHAEAVKDWVSNGGVLVLMGNDSVNCDLAGLNKLANIFGISFSNLSRNMVQGNEFATGAVILSEENELFKSAKKAYLKEVSILEVKQPAKAVISKNNEVVMAVSKYGKGTVFAVGDPWLYNEYVDGTKIPAEYENFLAGTELAKWLIELAKRN